MENSYKNYLEDCLISLIEKNKELRQKAEETKSAFDEGKSFGYYEALDFLLNQAEIFEIKKEFKPEIRDYSPSF